MGVYPCLSNIRKDNKGFKSILFQHLIQNKIYFTIHAKDYCMFTIEFKVNFAVHFMWTLVLATMLAANQYKKTLCVAESCSTQPQTDRQKKQTLDKERQLQALNSLELSIIKQAFLIIRIFLFYVKNFFKTFVKYSWNFPGCEQSMQENQWLLGSCFSVTKSCPTLCDPMDSSTPGFPICHLLGTIFLLQLY